MKTLLEREERPYTMKFEHLTCNLWPLLEFELHVIEEYVFFSL